MARRCGPTKPCGMSQGLFNPFFQNGAPWMGAESYSAESQAVFARMSTPLDTTYKNAIATFIDEQVSLSQWDNVLEFWLWANDTQANSLKGWIAIDSDLVNSPTHNALTGITLNGTNQYISSNFIPNTNAVGKQASLAVGCFIKENMSTANSLSLFGAAPTGGAGMIRIDQVPSSAAMNVFANTGTQLAVSEGTGDDKIFDSETEYTAVQLAGTAIMYKDGLNISSASRANSGLATVEIAFGATMFNATPLQFLNAKLCAGYVVDPTGFDFRAFHLGLKTMLQTLGVYSSTPELTILTGGEWFDFSQASLGTFASLLGRKGALTALATANAPSIEVEPNSGVRMARFESANSEAINLASVFQAMYDHSTTCFSMLMTVRPVDGTPSAAMAISGHTNGNNTQYVKLLTNGKIELGFKEAVQAQVVTTTDNAAFNDTPTAVTIILIEVVKDDMIVYVNGVRVNQTEGSWGTRAVTDFDGGTRNMYIGARNVDGTVTDAFDGYIGDFMIRSGKWSQSQKERLMQYFS